MSDALTGASAGQESVYLLLNLSPLRGDGRFSQLLNGFQQGKGWLRLARVALPIRGDVPPAVLGIL